MLKELASDMNYRPFSESLSNDYVDKKEYINLAYV